MCQVSDGVFIVGYVMLLIGVVIMFGDTSMSPTGTIKWFVFLEYSIWSCLDNVSFLVGIAVSFQEHVDDVDGRCAGFEWEDEYVSRCGIDD